MAFDAQCSPGPANSLRAMSLGLKGMIHGWSCHACCSSVALPGLSVTRSWSVLVLGSTGGLSLDVT